MQATKRQKFDRCNFKTYLKKKEQMINLSNR